MVILMREELRVVKDVNLIQLYLHRNKTIKQIPNQPCYILKGEEFAKVIDNVYHGIITRGGKTVQITLKKGTQVIY